MLARIAEEQPSPPSLTPAVAITSPLADKPKMIEPGALNPTSPPNATLVLALVTLTSACEPKIERGRLPKLKPTVGADKPAERRLGRGTAVDGAGGGEPLTVPRLMPASVPTVWDGTPGLAVTLTFARLRSRTTPRRR